MSAVEVMTTLAAEGIELAVRAGRLHVRPSVRDRPSLLALVQSHAAELRQLLGEAEHEAFEERAAIMEFDGGLTRDEAERTARTGKLPRSAETAPATRTWPFEQWGDLRPCVLCRNLSPGGRCLAAWRGELRAARDYSPTFTDLPQRCIGYQPKSDDPMRTSGRERWPELVQWQARINLPDGGAAA